MSQRIRPFFPLAKKSDVSEKEKIEFFGKMISVVVKWSRNNLGYSFGSTRVIGSQPHEFRVMRFLLRRTGVELIWILDFF